MTDSEKLDLILSKLNTLESETQDLKQRTTNIETNVTNIKTNVTDIKLTLENEIRVNIQRIAEGHLDLSRNLHEAMRPNNEVEMLAIKVRMLETDIRELRAKLA